MHFLKLTGITSFSVAGEPIVADENGFATASDEAIASPDFVAVRASLEDGQTIEFVEDQSTAKAGKKKG